MNKTNNNNPLLNNQYSAKEKNNDVILVDTAGRLQNKTNLMQELNKINKVIKKLVPDAPHETLLVIDATTGQNGISQAKSFKEITNITGIVLTKLDGTAKGGIVLAIKEEVGIPVKYVGLGETVEDLGQGVAWLGESDVVIHDACFAFSHKQNPRFVSHFLQSERFRSQIKIYRLFYS